MPNNNPIPDQVIKTGIVFGVTNLILTPLLFLESELGLCLAVAVNAGLIYFCHNMGKNRRPVQNAFNHFTAFFQPKNGPEVENAFNNIITGASALFDQFSL